LSDLRHTTSASKEELMKEQPVLDLKSVISILISCNFLRMEQLVKECISFVVSNIHDVVRLPINMTCINDQLIARIADRMPMQML
jgi:hypothetical protein